MNQAQIVNVQTFLNQHPFSAFQWQIFGLCFVIVLLDGFDTAAIGFIAPSLVNEWNISKPALTRLRFCGVPTGSVASICRQ